MRDFSDGKECSLCKEIKMLDEYYFDSNSNNYASRCKACIAQVRGTPEMKEKNNQRKQEYAKRLEYRIKRALGSRISSLVKGRQQTSKMLAQYLGCTFLEFKDWIEFQFEEGMGFDNYGCQWHIDHVKPCAAFNLLLSDDIEKCMHWTNLRPCWKTENLQKSSKLIPDLIEKHKQTVQLYMKSKSNELHNCEGAHNTTT